jgi:hypothetical protein
VIEKLDATAEREWKMALAESWGTSHGCLQDDANDSPVQAKLANPF